MHIFSRKHATIEIDTKCTLLKIIHVKSLRFEADFDVQ